MIPVIVTSLVVGFVIGIIVGQMVKVGPREAGK